MTHKAAAYFHPLDSDAGLLRQFKNHESMVPGLSNIGEGKSVILNYDSNILYTI